MSEAGPPAPRAEHPRDQSESEFTPILRRLWARADEVLAVAFVDQEGECIDYCASVPPFDAKIAGAHMRVVLGGVVDALRRLDAGETTMLLLSGETRDVLVRRLDEAYAVVALTVAGGSGVRAVLDGLEELVAALRNEGRIETPPWDRVRRALHVQLRAAVGWPYAPLAFVERGRRVRVTEVLGRWVEEAGARRAGVECFRVRTALGEELTLAHDPEQDAWIRR